MKILFFHQHFSTRSGSSATRTYEMARRLIDRGHEVTMVCASYEGGNTGLTDSFVKGRREGRVDGIQVIEFEIPYSNKLSFRRRVIAFAKYAVRSTMVALTKDYDLLFATSAPLSASIPGIAMKLFRIRKRPFVFEIRDPWPEMPRVMGIIKNPVVLGLMEMLETASYRAADACIALSPGMVDSFTQKRVGRELITMIPNGSDNDQVMPSTTRKFELPGIDANDFVAIYTGTLGMANGLDALIDAAAILKSQGVMGVKIVLIGDGGKKAALKQRVAEEELGVIVLFFDPIPKARLQLLSVEADLGLMILADVSVFYYSSSPNKFFDYLSYGIPILVNHPGWVKDLIDEAQCGGFADPKDPYALAAQIERFSKLSDDERIAMGIRGRKLAETQFDRKILTNRFVDTLEAAYSQWLTKHKPIRR